MNKLAYKLATGVTTGAILVGALAPAAFAATNATISGNGAASNNKIKVFTKNKTKVTQSNSTTVSNGTTINQNTGGNTANGNVGGGVTVNSGNATASVSNSTTAGSNVANIQNCGCPVGDTNSNITDNGAASTNRVRVKSTKRTRANQSNETLVENGTTVGQNTGDNHANNNVGDGAVSSDSSAASATVTNETVAGTNELNISPTPAL